MSVGGNPPFEAGPYAPGLLIRPDNPGLMIRVL